MTDDPELETTQKSVKIDKKSKKNPTQIPSQELILLIFDRFLIDDGSKLEGCFVNFWLIF